MDRVGDSQLNDSWFESRRIPLSIVTDFSSEIILSFSQDLVRLNRPLLLAFCCMLGRHCSKTCCSYKYLYQPSCSIALLSCISNIYILVELLRSTVTSFIPDIQLLFQLQFTSVFAKDFEETINVGSGIIVGAVKFSLLIFWCTKKSNILHTCKCI